MRKVTVRTPTTDRELLLIPENLDDIGGSTSDINTLILEQIRQVFSAEGWPYAEVLVDHIDTTDATPTDFNFSTLIANALGTQSIGMVETVVGAVSDDGVDSAIYQISAAFSRDAVSTYTQIGTTKKISTFKTDPTWGDVTFATDGVNIYVIVVGKAATNIRWTIDTSAGSKITRNLGNFPWTP